jgi:hypothetical protein
MSGLLFLMMALNVFRLGWEAGETGSIRLNFLFSGVTA